MGGSSHEGRVEVNHNGTWGTVCSYGWNIRNARVVCRQLGFKDAIASYQKNLPNYGKGQIWNDNYWCTGNESSLFSCPHGKEGGYKYCTHNFDVGVQCEVTGGEN